MRTWHDFLDSLNTPGGHIFILLVIMACCGIAYVKGVTAAGAMGTGAAGILYYAMRGEIRNAPGSTSSTTASTETKEKQDAPKP